MARWPEKKELKSSPGCLFRESKVLFWARRPLTLCQPPSTYFSATKYAWLLENVPAVRAAKEAETLMVGTVDSWLLYVRLFSLFDFALNLCSCFPVELYWWLGRWPVSQ